MGLTGRSRWAFRFLAITEWGQAKRGWILVTFATDAVIRCVVWMLIRMKNDMFNNVELYNVTQTVLSLIEPKHPKKHCFRANPLVEAKRLNRFWDVASSPLADLLRKTDGSAT